MVEMEYPLLTQHKVFRNDTIRKITNIVCCKNIDIR